MFRLTLPALAILTLTSFPSLAGHCPADAEAIDAALAKVTVSDEVRAQVTALKDEGLVEHEAGNHAESEATMAEAMRLLLNSL
jgi:hypothetical protein